MSEKSDSATGPFLLEDERAWIEKGRERCPACGHLEIFHNEHCCIYCTVDGCLCSWGKMPMSEIAKEIMS